MVDGHLFVPWVLFTLFAGFGPPLATAEGWVASATHQQVRYLILAVGGIVAAVGFSLLADRLATPKSNGYARAALTLIYISMPLYVLNMLYWGFFLTEAFRHFTAGGNTIRPDWYLAIRELFYWISTAALALLYLATALFGVALKKAGVFTPRACNAYIILNLFGFLCSLIPPFAPVPFDMIGYLVAVPAIGFIMPYLIALNLARVRLLSSFDASHH